MTTGTRGRSSLSRGLSLPSGHSVVSECPASIMNLKIDFYTTLYDQKTRVAFCVVIATNMHARQPLTKSYKVVILPICLEVEPRVFVPLYTAIERK